MYKLLVASVVCGGFVLGGCTGSQNFEARDITTASPKLSVDSSQLQQALSCTSNLSSAQRTPILLVPGTTIDPKSNFSWNWMPAFDALGWPYCSIELPQNSMGDIQEAAEYIVYAVRTMAAQSHQRVQILGHSQGGMVPRWALKYWPDIRADVEDMIGFSASNHGTILTTPLCVPGCAPALWQQDANSNFMAALNADFEVVPEVDYTSIYTNLDEVVFPNVTMLGASSALNAEGDNVANVATQDVCPLNLAEHLLVGTSDPVAYAIAIDALSNDGPADISRIDGGVCFELLMPGVNPLTFATDAAAAGAVLSTTLLTAEKVSEEPPLKCYVDGSCSAD